jgi:DNA-binding transcriptional ArsR family regulator
MTNRAPLRVVGEPMSTAEEQQELDLVFAALSDPVRRGILERLDGRDLLVSEVAAHFDISLQAISRHLQVLVRAGLVTQERSGRISRCRFDATPIYGATLWLNRFSKYWQAQFDLLAISLEDLAREQPGKPRPTQRGSGRAKRRAARKATTSRSED